MNIVNKLIKWVQPLHQKPKYVPSEGKLALAKWLYENPNAYREVDKEYRQQGKNFYRMWDQAAEKSGGIGPNYDYGAVQSQTRDSRKHYSDAGKLPNHITFSNENAYSNKITPFKSKTPLKGGNWEGNIFTPTKTQVEHGILDRLQWMMDNNHNNGDQYMNPINNTILQKK